MQNENKILRGDAILQNLDSVVQRNSLHFELKGLTKPTRDILDQVIQGILGRIGANPLAGFHLFSGVMEALLNAVKGNLRHTIFRDELFQKLLHSDSDDPITEQEAEELLNVILDTSPLRDAMQRYVVPDKLKKTVQKILQLQDKVRSKKVDLSDPEKAFLKEAKAKIDKDLRKISLKIKLSDKELYLRIRNDSPIMGLDLKRIEASREKHAELAKDGNSADFFRPDFLDEKESAGFGIAMIDEGFYNMGIDPLEHFSLISSNHVTTAYMTYPLEDLQRMDF
ncbi:MAG: hypothetical protein JJT78_10485 [Leptospira sp.]|nr:hypothetical protein [Leptospira sp.]